MEDKIKLTREEFESIQEIQKETQMLTFELGMVEISNIRNNERKSELIKKLGEISKNDITILDGLYSKYGKGSVDFKTGEFIKML